MESLMLISDDLPMNLLLSPVSPHLDELLQTDLAQEITDHAFHVFVVTSSEL